MWLIHGTIVSKSSQFLMMFGKRGHGRGELDRPVGVAIETLMTRCMSLRVATAASPCSPQRVTSLPHLGRD